MEIRSGGSLERENISANQGYRNTERGSRKTEYDQKGVGMTYPAEEDVLRRQAGVSRVRSPPVI